MTKAWPAAANPGDITTWMPEIEPITPDPNSPALNPVEIAFCGLTGANNGPNRAKSVGCTARISRPPPRTLLYAVAAAPHRRGGDLGLGRGGVERRPGRRPGEQIGNRRLLGLDGVLTPRGRR